MNFEVMQQDNNLQAFFELVKAGLWEREVRLSQFGEIDYMEVLRLAEEQSVTGLVAAGIDHVTDIKIPQEYVLQFVGNSLQIEQGNQAMNRFIAFLVEKLRNVGVYTLLLKGQGVAQCYERPMWRVRGDVDFFLSKSNYEKAKTYLSTFATTIGNETEHEKHFELTIDNWIVDLHGSLRCGLSSKIDKVIDDIQHSVFYGGDARSWINGKTHVFLPGANSDVFFIFTHFLKHF